MVRDVIRCVVLRLILGLRGARRVLGTLKREGTGRYRGSPSLGADPKGFGGDARGQGRQAAGPETVGFCTPDGPTVHQIPDHIPSELEPMEYHTAKPPRGDNETGAAASAMVETLKH